MRFGQILFLILFFLIALALIGIIDWNVVGEWGIFMLILAVAGPTIGLIGYIFFHLKEKNDNKSAMNLRSKIGRIINWLIILTGIIIVAFIFISGYIRTL